MFDDKMFKDVMKKLEIRRFAQNNFSDNNQIDQKNDEAYDFSELFKNLENVNKHWNIKDECEIKSHRPITGNIIVFAKRVIRKISKWYITSIIRQQRIFNSYTTKTLNSIKLITEKMASANLSNSEDIKLLERKVKQLDMLSYEIEEIKEKVKEIEEIKEKLKEIKEVTNTLEVVKENALQVNILSKEIEGLKKQIIEKDGIIENLNTKSNVLGTYLNDHSKELDKLKTVNTYLASKIEYKLGFNKPNNLGINYNKYNTENENKTFKYLDYFMFELNFRGSIEDIQERQKIYLAYVKENDNALDIGCGRGEFLELLFKNGVKAIGIDIDENMVNFCKKRGLNAEYIDAINYLQSIEDKSLDIISMFQVIEHLSNEELLQIFQLCYDKLRSGGYLLLETPNPMSLVIFTQSFYMDLTHLRPIHPYTAKFICDSLGFKEVELKFISESSEVEKFQYPSNDTNMINLIDKLNDIIYGHKDYALICKK